MGYEDISVKTIEGNVLRVEIWVDTIMGRDICAYCKKSLKNGAKYYKVSSVRSGLCYAPLNTYYCCSIEHLKKLNNWK